MDLEIWTNVYLAGCECLHEELSKAARRTSALLCANIVVVVGSLQVCSGLDAGGQRAAVPNALVVVAVCDDRFVAIGWAKP